MKKNSLIFASLALVLFACQTTEAPKQANKKSTSSPTKIESNKEVPTNHAAKLIKGSYAIVAGKGQDTATSKISYVFYEDDGQLTLWQKAINDFIKKSLYRPEGTKVSSDPLSVNMIEKSMNDFKRYANRNHSTYEMTYTMSDAYTIDESHQDFVTLTSVTSFYEGGAHGDYGTGYFQIDKQTGKELKLTDFITDVKEFNRIAEKYFKKSQGIPSNVSVGSKDYSFDFWFENDQFACNDNFYLDENSIHFMYMPYEISNYAVGTIEFSVPLKKIEHLLKRH